MKILAKQCNQIMAEQLRVLRQDANLTMRQLATELNTPHSFVGKIELSGRRLDVGEFVQYCQAMQQNPVEVLQAIVDKQ